MVDKQIYMKSWIIAFSEINREGGCSALIIVFCAKRYAVVAL